MKRTNPHKVTAPLATIAALAVIFCSTTVAMVDAASVPGAHAKIVFERSIKSQQTTPDYSHSMVCDSGTKIEGCVSQRFMLVALPQTTLSSSNLYNTPLLPGDPCHPLRCYRNLAIKKKHRTVATRRTKPHRSSLFVC